jgi:hypothetical protein
MPVFWIERIAVSRPEPGTLHLDVDLADAVLHGPAGRGLRGHLRRERRRLAGPLEAHVAGPKAHDRTLPSWSVKLMIVLLKLDLM